MLSWLPRPGTARRSPSPTTRSSSRATTTSPREAVTATLTESDTHTVCPWKGTASYFSVEVDGKVNEDAAWYYPAPKDAAAEIKDRVAFWKGVQVSA